jgi:DNA polymerase III alpha subunit
LGYVSLGVADRGPLAAFPAFSKAARQAGIKPVYGMEADIVLPSTSMAAASTVRPATFFARDKQGMDNLARLASLAYARWPQEEQPLSWEAVAEHSAGLALVLLAQNEGTLASASADDLDQWGASIRGCFGETAFIGVAHQDVQGLIAAAERMALQMVAMPAARYIRPEDKLSYEALQVARSRAGWAQSAHGSVVASGSCTQHLLSPEDVAAQWATYPEALENAAQLTEMCAGVGYLDEFATQTLQAGTPVERPRLQSLAEEHLLRRLEVDTLPEAVRQWLDDELAAYDKQNALAAWSALGAICERARSRNGSPASPLGAPLGTVDGSLLAYAFGISLINPVDYPRPSWLLANEGTRVLPVPGIELPANKRDEMIADLAHGYGDERTALAACFIDIDPLMALSAASEVLGTGADIRPLALQAISQGWSAFAADQTGSESEVITPAGLALTLKATPIAVKPDPDMLLVAPAGAKLPSWLPVLRRDESRTSAWVPVTEETVAEMRLPAVALRPSATLAALANTVAYIAQYPVPGLAVEDLDLTGYPQLSPEVSKALTKGDLVGIPYLSPAAVKGWKGELTPAALATLVARSAATRKPADAPKLDAWAEHTENTGGSLLFRDQFEVLVTAVAGFAPAEAHHLRRLLLKGGTDDATVQLKERFSTGCVERGIDAEATETLWQGLAASAPDLQSRCSIAVRARTVMWAAFFKATHPAAFVAAHLLTAIGRGATAVPQLVGAAHRLGVGIKAPDVSHSQPVPTLERGGSEWTILWGLTLLPGWSPEVASRFAAARPRGGFTGMADLVQAAVVAGANMEQLEVLVRSGACDSLGGKARSRDGLLEALPEWLDWARSGEADSNAAGAGPVDLFSFNDAQPAAPPSEEATLGNDAPTPRERYLRREWELTQLGVAFTPATEMESLKREIERSHLRARLLRSAQIGEEHVGKSINLVGLLTCVRTVSSPPTNGSAPGECMCVAWVEDTEGAIELVAFPQSYKRHADLWAENRAVIVTGRVRKHAEGDVYLLCEHLAAFEEAPEEAELTIKVKQSKKAQAALEEVTAKVSPPGTNGTNGSNGSHAPGPMTAHAPAPKPATIPPTPTAAAVPTPMTAAASTANTATTAPTMTNPATTTTGGPPAHKIIITLPISEDDRADIDRMIALKEILQEHPGTDVVTLRIPYAPEPGHLTTAQLPRGVAYNTVLEAEVVRLLGTEAIAVIRL